MFVTRYLPWWADILNKRHHKEPFRTEEVKLRRQFKLINPLIAAPLDHTNWPILRPLSALVRSLAASDFVQCETSGFEKFLSYAEDYYSKSAMTYCCDRHDKYLKTGKKVKGDCWINRVHVLDNVFVGVLLLYVLQLQTVLSVNNAESLGLPYP